MRAIYIAAVVEAGIIDVPIRETACNAGKEPVAQLQVRPKALAVDRVHIAGRAALGLPVAVQTIQFAPDSPVLVRKRTRGSARIKCWSISRGYIRFVIYPDSTPSSGINFHSPPRR